MKVIKKIIIFIIVIILIAIFIMPKNIFASDDIPESEFATYRGQIEYSQETKFFGIIQKILTILRGISIFVGVISVTIIGVKYIVGSVEEKAQYKEKMIPVAIGAFLIAGISTILIAIDNIMN